jgi:hypothetical protein
MGAGGTARGYTAGECVQVHWAAGVHASQTHNLVNTSSNACGVAVMQHGWVPEHTHGRSES